MQETFDIHGYAGMLGGEIRLRPFPEVLKEVQEHITKNYASTLKDEPDESRDQSNKNQLLVKSTSRNIWKITTWEWRTRSRRNYAN